MPTCFCGARTAARFYMVDRKSRSYVEEVRALHARISSQRVLCVDNNPYLREFVRWFFSDVGCAVSAVANAAEAISLIADNPANYDLLIMADWLPDMQGLELLRQLRALGCSKRVVITTPHELSPERQQTYRTLGVSLIIVTPLGYHEVMRILQESMAQNGLVSRNSLPAAVHGCEL